MGYINVSLVFKKIISSLQQKCQAEMEHQNICDCGLEFIMDDIVLFKILLAIILQFFRWSYRPCSNNLLPSNYASACS